MLVKGTAYTGKKGDLCKSHGDNNFSQFCSRLPTKDHRHLKARDKFDNILLPITICCMHASMPPKRTWRRLRGYPPESQEKVEVGRTDEEASPPPGSARVDYSLSDVDREAAEEF